MLAVGDAELVGGDEPHKAFVYQPFGIEERVGLVTAQSRPRDLEQLVIERGIGPVSCFTVARMRGTQGDRERLVGHASILAPLSRLRKV